MPVVKNNKFPSIVFLFKIRSSWRKLNIGANSPEFSRYARFSVFARRARKNCGSWNSHSVSPWEP